ncbi:hypothetical protein Tco_1335856 [Tanacetum coccineum]
MIRGNGCFEYGFGIDLKCLGEVGVWRFQRSDKLKCKGPVIEENTIEDAINVEEYLSEDENVSQDEGIEHIIGTQVDNKDVDTSISDIVKDEEMIKNWEEQFGTKKVTPNDVKHMIRNTKVADMNFKLNFITSELLKERELAEIKSGGIGKGELVGPYVEEEDDPMPENLEGFMWKINYYIECIKSERTGFDKTMDATKLLYPGNTLLAKFEDRYIQSLSADMEDNKGNAGQAPLEAVPLNYVTPVKAMMRHGKRVLIETDCMKSPFYVRVVNADKDENSDEKRLYVYIFSKMAGNVRQKSSRGQIESLGPQELVDNNVLSSWSGYLNLLEGKKDKNSPARLFLPVFEVDTEVLGENAQTTKRFMVYAKHSHSTYRWRTKLDKADIHKIFGQYLLVINHGKAPEIIKSQLVHGTFHWQTDKRSKDYGIFMMRHMEAYMSNELGKWKCGLDVEGKNQNTQLRRLRNKYAAKLLLSYCNIYNSKIREEMDRMKFVVFNVKQSKSHNMASEWKHQ